MTGRPSARNSFARELFRDIACDYEIWSKALSFWQDLLWRCAMVRGSRFPVGSLILDVAAGTGQVTRLLEKSGFKTIALDQSPEMLKHAAHQGSMTVNARAEALPFRDKTFDGLTFTYLLRYIDEPLACMRELVRVVRPGGEIGMVEFGRPVGIWRPLWRFYTRFGLPLAGKLIGQGWLKVGLFLGNSIDEFHDRYSMKSLVSLWRRAGLIDIRVERPSLGGGLLMWGTKA